MNPNLRPVASAAIIGGLKMLSDLPKGGSLVGYAQAGTIEPTAFIDEDLRGYDLLPDTLQLAQSVYIAYFLRAFSLHNISVGNASVASRLDKFSTHRSPVGSGANTAFGLASLAMESFEDRLPVMGVKPVLSENVQYIKDAAEKVAALESLEDKQPGQRSVSKNTPQPTAAGETKSIFGKTMDDLKSTETVSFKTVDVLDPVTIAQGKMVNVTIKEDGREVVIPIHIRLNAHYMASRPLIHILGSGSEDISFGARFKKYRLGGIDFWRDLVMCQDLIDAHKANLKADKTNVYLQMMQKRTSNSLSSILSGSMSANSASNITVLSKASADELELKIGGKLKDFNTRQKLFQQGYGMLMFIVDKQWGTVRMYTRDIPDHTELQERDIRASAKGNGVDIGDVLTAFRAGGSMRT